MSFLRMLRDYLVVTCLVKYAKEHHWDHRAMRGSVLYVYERHSRARVVMGIWTLCV